MKNTEKRKGEGLEHDDFARRRTTDYAPLHLLKILFSFLVACHTLLLVIIVIFFGHMNNKLVSQLEFILFLLLNQNHL